MLANGPLLAVTVPVVNVAVGVVDQYGVDDPIGTQSNENDTKSSSYPCRHVQPHFSKSK